MKFSSLLGKLQMEGVSKSIEKDIWQGKVTWYKENGAIYQQGTYDDHKLNGDFITFSNNKKFTAKYEKGYFISGKRNSTSRRNNSQCYFEKENDTLKEVFYDKDLKGIRIEYLGTTDNPRSITKFYGKDGEHLGDFKRSKNGKSVGIYASYNYDPMRLSSVDYYKNGVVIGSDFYFLNGQPIEKFQQEPEYTTTYFNPDGTEIGKVVYALKRDYLKPISGTKFDFSSRYTKSKERRIIQKTIYKDEKVLERTSFYDNGVKKQFETYTESYKELQISYDNMGKETARITYNSKGPQEGVEIVRNRKSTYKDGKLILGEVFYPETQQIFSTKKDLVKIFYDKNGKELSKLTFMNTTFSEKPLDGKRYVINHEGEVVTIEDFKNSVRTKQTSFTQYRDQNKIFKRETFYAQDGYLKVKEVEFYSNNKKKSEITFKSYNKFKGTFYNQNEQVLGSYNYAIKEGVLYEFFYNTDIVSKIKEEKNGKLIKNKVYEQVFQDNVNTKKIVLIKDVDVNCCAKFYNKAGDLIAEVEFKDGKPFEGQLFDSSTRELFTVKKGNREGEYKQLGFANEPVKVKGQYKNDLKEGTFQYFNYKGDLKKEENYAGGKLDGKSVFYNTDGSEASRLVYKDGKPHEGKEVSGDVANGRGKQIWYKKGAMVKKLEYNYDYKGMTETLVTKNGQENNTQYTGKTKQIVYKYTTQKGVLSGKVIKYDDNGKKVSEAVFEKGQLQSGKLFIKSKSSYESEYISIEKNNNSLKVEYFDENNTLIFKAEELIPPNSQSVFINKLNLYYNTIVFRDLY